MLAYCDSKLFNLLFTVELARRLARTPTAHSIVVNAVHPGEVTTDISRNLPGWMGRAHKAMGRWMLLSPAKSAWTVGYLLLAGKELRCVSGKFFWHVTRGPLWSVPCADNLELRRDVWDTTIGLAGMTPTEQCMAWFD